MDLDSLVAAIAGQPAQTQASCASIMVANAFYFAAMKAVFVFPEVLKAVLDDIHLQVSMLMFEMWLFNATQVGALTEPR